MAGERIARELGLTTFQLWCAVGAAFAVGVMTNARSIASTLSLSLIGAAFLYPAPKPETFQGFFKSWFLDKYMPVAGKLYRDKLKRQSRNGILSFERVPSYPAMSEQYPPVNSTRTFSTTTTNSILPK